MPRPLPIALIATLCLASNALAIGKTPAAMKRIIEKAVVEVKKNRQDFEQANKAPLTDAREELQALAQNLIGDGKTEEATVVLRQVKTLDADVLRMAKAPDPAPAPEPRPGPQKPLLERMAGKWHMDHWDMVIEQDGSCRQVRKDNGGVDATGRFVLNDAGVAEARLTNGYSWLCSMPIGDDKLVVFFRNPEGQRTLGGVVHERVK